MYLHILYKYIRVFIWMTARMKQSLIVSS